MNYCGPSSRVRLPWKPPSTVMSRTTTNHGCIALLFQSSLKLFENSYMTKLREKSQTRIFLGTILTVGTAAIAAKSTGYVQRRLKDSYFPSALLFSPRRSRRKTRQLFTRGQISPWKSRTCCDISRCESEPQPCPHSTMLSATNCCGMCFPRHVHFHRNGNQA